MRRSHQEAMNLVFVLQAQENCPFQLIDDASNGSSFRYSQKEVAWEDCSI